MGAVPIEEKHYTAAELAELWSLERDSIIRLFKNEPGVLVFGNKISTRHKRAYTVLRIPASVAERVYRRLINKTA